ncbi:MAG: STAS domain-containing protein [Lachnospiraceae bacterium]|nr:STAS domain-containing protein [Lachnospiraceae bacterium]
MTIEKVEENGKLKLKLIGRLDTNTVHDLEAVITESLDGVTDLHFDLSELEYVSSAGLRALLAAQKAMRGKGEMVITGVNDEVMEVFDVTGFIDILNIK